MNWPICYEYVDGEWIQLENPLENAFTDWPDGMEMDTYLEEKQYCAEARLDGLPDIALYVRKRQVDNDLARTYPYIVAGAFTDLWVVVCIRDLPQVRPVLEEFVALQKLLTA